MKKNISVILFVIIVILMGVLLGCAIIKNRNKNNNDITFNYKKGDVVTVNNMEITILNISQIKCGKKDKCDNEVEVSVKIKNDDIYTYYTLQSYHKPEDVIKDTNLKVYLSYADEKIAFDIK